jgi:uncharacterized membrane protein YqjE
MSVSGNDFSDLSTAARRVSASLVEGIHLRLDLFAIEFDEERRRIATILLTTLAVALAGFMVFLCVNVALLIVFWDEWRAEVALGLCGFYSVILLGLVFANSRRIRRGTRAFEATREVLEADRRSLRETS